MVILLNVVVQTKTCILGLSAFALFSAWAAQRPGHQPFIGSLIRILKEFLEIRFFQDRNVAMVDYYMEGFV
jgi:hypothetical protein